MNVSVFKDLFKSQDVPFIVPIEKIIKRIQQGTSKDLINKIRTADTKELRNALKTELPFICRGIFRA
mgnify:CR=1 FL=1